MGLRWIDTNGLLARSLYNSAEISASPSVAVELDGGGGGGLFGGGGRRPDGVGDSVGGDLGNGLGICRTAD